MAGRPWRKWWGGDWLRDPKVGRLSAEARGVWREILDLMDEHGDDCYSVSGTAEELARMCRMTLQEITRGIIELERFDVCDVTVSKRDADRDAGVTQTVTQALRDRDGNAVVTLASRRLEREAERRQNSLEKGRKRSKRYREKKAKEGGVTLASRSRHASKTPRHARVRADSDSESSLTTETSTTNPAKARKTSDRKKAIEPVGRFEEAWDLYAHKVGRLDAVKAWNRLSDEARDLALAAIDAYVARTDPNGAGGLTRRAHFATWLNGERWLDQPGRSITTTANHHATDQRLSARQYAGLSLEDKLRRARIID